MTRTKGRPASALRDLLKNEAAGGIVLVIAAAIAMILANSPAAPLYFDLLKAHVASLSVLHWINDALMAVFFLLVGLEIKRELLDGQLSSWPRRILPGVAAGGGMIAPALLFVAFNSGSPETLRGWAIPTATDIAFALGVLAMLGSRVPVSLKIFLTALAILDDLGAVAIIAAFYTSSISPLWLAAALAMLAVLSGLNWLGVRKLAIYLPLGAFLWFFLLKSGVHATLSGVALALTVPMTASPGRPDDTSSSLHTLEQVLQPWVAFLIVPVFGFANAGVSLAGVNLASLMTPVPLGIAAGLFFGKQIGVFLAAWTVIKLHWADCPQDASMAQVYGVAVLCGIGFTMSLFIGLLAYPDSELLQGQVKVGVLMGSILSAVAGSILLLFFKRER
jgi:NhaA family Na+:H+ antiporter